MSLCNKLHLFSRANKLLLRFSSSDERVKTCIACKINCSINIYVKINQLYTILVNISLTNYNKNNKAIKKNIHKTTVMHTTVMHIKVNNLLYNR